MWQKSPAGWCTALALSRYNVMSFKTPPREEHDHAPLPVCGHASVKEGGRRWGDKEGKKGMKAGGKEGRKEGGRQGKKVLHCSQRRHKNDSGSNLGLHGCGKIQVLIAIFFSVLRLGFDVQCFKIKIHFHVHLKYVKRALTCDCVIGLWTDKLKDIFKMSQTLTEYTHRHVLLNITEIKEGLYVKSHLHYFLHNFLRFINMPSEFHRLIHAYYSDL